jgi:hypothetical protein
MNNNLDGLEADTAVHYGTDKKKVTGEHGRKHELKKPNWKALGAGLNYLDLNAI